MAADGRPPAGKPTRPGAHGPQSSDTPERIFLRFGGVPPNLQQGLDGRGRRREQNKEAVLDAVLGLLAEGAVPPTAEAISRRSGVSLRSLFRYWPSLSQVLVAASELYVSRHADLLTYHVEPDDDRPLPTRVSAFVDHWARFFDEVGPMARVAVALSAVDPYFVELDAASRRATGAAIEVLFERELLRMEPVDRRAAVAEIHTAVILETWETVVNVHQLALDTACAIAERRIA